MRRWRCRAAWALLCLCAIPAQAEELRTRLELGVRSGLAFPVGDISRGGALVDYASWAVPLQVDAGARIGPVFVGGFFSYGFGRAGKLLDGAGSRSVSDVRLGFEVLWHFAPDARLDPWAGVGVGYEWLNLKATTTDGALSASFRGFEFVDAQLGVDFAVGSVFRLGPWVQATLGQYSSGSVDLTFPTLSGSGSGDVMNKALHSWISVGLRLAVVL
jgi:hypothetical protein